MQSVFKSIVNRLFFFCWILGCMLYVIIDLNWSQREGSSLCVCVCDFSESILGRTLSVIEAFSTGLLINALAYYIFTEHHASPPPSTPAHPTPSLSNPYPLSPFVSLQSTVTCVQTRRWFIDSRQNIKEPADKSSATPRRLLLRGGSVSDVLPGTMGDRQSSFRRALGGSRLGVAVRVWRWFGLVASGRRRRFDSCPSLPSPAPHPILPRPLPFFFFFFLFFSFLFFFSFLLLFFFFSSSSLFFFFFLGLGA